MVNNNKPRVIRKLIKKIIQNKKKLDRVIYVIMITSKDFGKEGWGRSCKQHIKLWNSLSLSLSVNFYHAF